MNEGYLTEIIIHNNNVFGGSKVAPQVDLRDKLKPHLRPTRPPSEAARKQANELRVTKPWLTSLSVSSFSSSPQVRVPPMHEPHVRDGAGGGMLELGNAGQRQGGAGQVVPDAGPVQRADVLPRLPQSVQEALLLQRLLQQRDTAPVLRYGPAR